jgi:hypothetical protein
LTPATSHEIGSGGSVATPPYVFHVGDAGRDDLQRSSVQEITAA